jgi:hypothetical protein
MDKNLYITITEMILITNSHKHPFPEWRIRRPNNVRTNDDVLRLWCHTKRFTVLFEMGCNHITLAIRPGRLRWFHLWQ